jgi:hypothetical protein
MPSKRVEGPDPLAGIDKVRTTQPQPPFLEGNGISSRETGFNRFRPWQQSGTR